MILKAAVVVVVEDAGCSTEASKNSVSLNRRQRAFNDDRIYMEKFLQNPRHINFKFTDTMKRDSFRRRDCSLQRRHQKVIENVPSDISQKEKKLKHVC